MPPLWLREKKQEMSAKFHQQSSHAILDSCVFVSETQRRKVMRSPTLVLSGSRKKRGLREGTHNVLAAPVLMLRPAGPLADRAKAILVFRWPTREVLWHG